MKDKQNLPQLIVVCVLALFCLGYVGYKITAKKPVKNKTQQAKTEKTTATASNEESQAQASVDDNMVVTVPASNMAMQVRRDPFVPAMDISDKPMYSPAPSYAPTRVATRPPVRPLIAGLDFGGRLPGATPYGAGAGRSSESSDSEQRKPDPKPLPEFVLTGIITGRSNVAIIRLGEGRYIAKEGQIINGAYKVVSVSQDGVLLSHDGRAFFLKLGGEGNAS